MYAKGNRKYVRGANDVKEKDRVRRYFRTSATGIQVHFWVVEKENVSRFFRTKSSSVARRSYSNAW